MVHCVVQLWDRNKCLQRSANIWWRHYTVTSRRFSEVFPTKVKTMVRTCIESILSRITTLTPRSAHFECVLNSEHIQTTALVGRLWMYQTVTLDSVYSIRRCDLKSDITDSEQSHCIPWQSHCVQHCHYEVTSNLVCVSITRSKWLIKWLIKCKIRSKGSWRGSRDPLLEF